MKEQLQRIAATAAEWVPDALMASGAAAIAYGSSLVYLPAGWVVGGAFVLAGGVLLARGDK